MSWTEVTKNRTKPILVRGAVTVTRLDLGDYNTRGEIAEEIFGDAGEEVTRKDIEDRFGQRKANDFTETDNNNSDWSEV